MAKFKDVISCLKHGGTATRQAWNDKNIEVMMQIPQRIAKEIVPKMTSVQESIKPKISTVGSGEIEYHDQVLIITFVDDEKTPAKATYYVPSWEDIFAEDWIVHNSLDSYSKCLVEDADETALHHDELLVDADSIEGQLIVLRKLHQTYSHHSLSNVILQLESRQKERNNA